MTGTQHLHGPGTGLFGQIGRWLTLAAVTVVAAFMLFFSAAFALILISAIAILVLIAVSIFWLRAKLTGRPFGPRAQMDVRMADIRRQMGADIHSAPQQAKSGGPVIDAHETPEGWTVER
ncbi:MAG: hypothetical protein ACSHX3_07180 [Litorimonas sp.]